MMQEYQLFDENVIYYYSMPPMYTTDYKHKRIAIGIKQNKEDMEMKKVFMNGDDRDYLLDRLEDILHDNHCLEYKDEICNSLCKYITSNNRELKPFNLEAAKAGKPVCTKDGKKVRVICFDKVGAYPIIALVQEGCMETCHFYSQDGKCADSGSEYDLVILSEKKEGWVNIYKSDNGTYYTGAIFYEKNDALVNTAEIEITTGIPIDCIDTVKITWEE